MKHEFLKNLNIEGLTDEAIDKIMGENGKDVEAIKAKFEAAETEKTALQGTLKERDGQLETLKNSTGDIEGLKKQITELQTVNGEKDKTHAAEILTLKINAAVDSALTAAKAKNGKAVRALLNLDKVELSDDGTVKGLADQIKALQGAEDSKFLFDEAAKKTTVKGASPAETGKEDPDTKVDVTKMTYEELAAYMDANPDTKF